MLKGYREEGTSVCTSTSPVARARVLVQRLGSQRWRVSLSQSPLLWWWCPLQAFFLLLQSNSFMKQSEVISKSSKLCSHGDFIRRIYSVTQCLTRHPGISFKLPLLPPRKNPHAASQTLKIRWESPCHSGPNQLSWLAPACSPATLTFLFVLNPLVAERLHPPWPNPLLDLQGRGDSRNATENDTIYIFISIRLL